MKKAFILICLTFMCGTQLDLLANEKKDNPGIQLALLLDSSGSMSGLIEQAKSQLWMIVNEFNELRFKGVIPEIRISVYEYGQNPYGPATGYIKQRLPFTTDIDMVSRELFAMYTNGSSEHCPQVVHKALTELEWGQAKNEIRMIYIAGNEVFQQGPIMLESACALTEAKKVMLNAIFCGPLDKGVSLRWKEAADCGGGEYLNINHNRATVYIKSPYDEEIDSLNKKFNTTYISYGSRGSFFRQNQIDQDLNATYYGMTNSGIRNKYKISSNYRNDHWDLCDAYEKDKNVLLKKELLSQELRDMTNDELEEYVQNKIAEREELTCRLRELQDKRTLYVRNKKLENENSNDPTLSSKISSSIRAVAKRKGFDFN